MNLQINKQDMHNFSTENISYGYILREFQQYDKSFSNTYQVILLTQQQQ